MSLVPVTSDAIERASDPTALVMAWCERGREALTEATTLDDGQHVLAAISTLEHATRVQKLNGEVCIAASALRVRAERRIGELIREEREAGRLAVHGGARRFNVVRPDVETEAPATLADRGISRDQAAEYARLAAAPEPEFEEAVEKVATWAKAKGGLNVTRSGVLRTINPDAEKRADERWIEADRFITAARKMTRMVEPFLTATRFGIYPNVSDGDEGDAFLRQGVERVLAEAATAIEQARAEMRKVTNLDGNTVRSVKEIAQKILANNGSRVSLQVGLGEFDHEATHAEWDQAARTGIADQLRRALRANNARKVGESYAVQGVLTFEERLELAILQARRGRAFFDDVRRMTAPRCLTCGANDVRPGPCQPWCHGVKTWLGEGPKVGVTGTAYGRWANGYRAPTAAGQWVAESRTRAGRP